jgi:hypothetical protein
MKIQTFIQSKPYSIQVSLACAVRYFRGKKKDRRAFEGFFIEASLPSGYVLQII